MNPSVMALGKFLKDQEISSSQWDLLIFGDGSGAQWKDGGGCCAFIIDNRHHVRTCLISAQSRATVNRMELRAYVDALGVHYNELLDGKIHKPPYRVWIFSDSEYTVKCGNREYGRKANLDLWAVIDWFETRGYRLRWRWLPRNSNALHTKADALAGKARIAIKDLLLSEEEVYRLLPSTDTEQKPVNVKLTTCSCGAPMLLSELLCPQCGCSRNTLGGSLGV
jgi:ribonuclease HI